MVVLGKLNARCIAVNPWLYVRDFIHFLKGALQSAGSRPCICWITCSVEMIIWLLIAKIVLYLFSILGYIKMGFSLDYICILN